MPKVEIYTRVMCGYCTRAMRLLQSKGVEFEEIEAGYDREKRQEMAKRSGGRTTFPQVFVDGAPIGGSDELAALDRDGKLDGILGVNTEE